MHIFYKSMYFPEALLIFCKTAIDLHQVFCVFFSFINSSHLYSSFDFLIFIIIHLYIS